MDVLTDDESETFINLVSQHPCLYDSKDPNHKDLRIKENIWKEIADTLNKTSKYIFITFITTIVCDLQCFLATILHQLGNKNILLMYLELLSLRHSQIHQHSSF